MTSTGIVRLSQNFLNDINDPYPGQSSSGAANPNQYLGQLGQYLILNEGQANQLSDTLVATLHAGVYQYVQFLSTSTAANVAGGPVYWSAPGAGTGTTASFVVTPDPPTGLPNFAGVSLNAVTKGNYGFILIEGWVAAKTVASVSNGSAAIGDSVVVTTAAGGFDDPSAASVTYLLYQTIVGQWLAVPTNAALKLAYIRGQKNAGAA